MQELRTIVITGCSTRSSLGYKIAEHLSKMDGFYIIGLVGIEDGQIDISSDHGGCLNEIYAVDFTKGYDEEVYEIKQNHEKIYCLINCAGTNNNEWFEDINDKSWYDTNDVNAKSIYKMSQGLLSSIINCQGTILNIVSQSSHLPMTGSLCYNASKAAASMMTSQMARELTRKYNITIFSISPNKIDGTEMTKKIDEQVPELRGWTREDSDNYQLNALLTGKKTNPDTLAEFTAFLLSTKERHFYLSGCDIPYGV